MQSSKSFNSYRWDRFGCCALTLAVNFSVSSSVSEKKNSKEKKNLKERKK